MPDRPKAWLWGVVYAWGVALALAFTPAVAGAVMLARGPYLQLLTAQSVTIVWKTDVPAGCSVAITPTDGETTTIPGAIGTICAVAVAHLTPGAEYGYVPLADGVALDAESFFRADDPDRPFSFLVVGDSGAGDANQLAVRDRMLAVPADFILSTGDMIYNSGLPAEFDPVFFAPYRELLRRLVFWPTLGNHDVQTLGGQPWRDAFYTPANNPQASENYYSFDAGNAHVVVLDSNASISPGSAQYQFLDGDLATSTATWKFVAFHHTIYSSGIRHGSDLLIRGNLVPLFDRYGVDIVFMGHDHDYERTWPMRANLVAASGTGTVYVTTGGGGRALNAVGQSTFTAYSESAFHFTRVAVDGDVLGLEMIRADGAVRDATTLTKQVATSTTTTPGASTTTTTSTTLATLSFSPVADAYVDASTASTNYGTAGILTADASPASVAYLRFAVAGIGARVVTRATLRLTVNSAVGAESPSGGSVHAIGNHGWQEGVVTYQSRPAVDGPVLATQGSVARNQVVDFDVGAAIRQDGTYDFALDSQSTDGVRYISREGTAGRPQLIVVTGGASVPTTTTSTTTTSTGPSSTTTSTTASSTSTTTTTSTTTSTITAMSASSTSTTTTSTSTATSTSIITTTTGSSTTTTTAPPPTILDVRVRASTDDAEESSAKKVNLTSSDLELVNDGNNQVIGMRFTGIGIPRGAKIVDAYIQFQVDEATSSATSLTVRGENADNAAAFTSATGNVSSRSRTAASVAWAPPAWPTVGATGTAQRTPGLAAVIQAIVDRPGWVTGRSMAIIITGTGKRVAKAYDGSAAGAPLLHIAFRPGG